MDSFEDPLAHDYLFTGDSIPPIRVNDSVSLHSSQISSRPIQKSMHHTLHIFEGNALGLFCVAGKTGNAGLKQFSSIPTCCHLAMFWFRS